MKIRLKASVIFLVAALIEIFSRYDIYIYIYIFMYVMYRSVHWLYTKFLSYMQGMSCSELKKKTQYFLKTFFNF